MGEDIKVSVRNHRRSANDAFKTGEKEGTISKDDAKKGQDKTQKQTDDFIKQIDELLRVKEAECMEV